VSRQPSRTHTPEPWSCNQCHQPRATRALAGEYSRFMWVGTAGCGPASSRLRGSRFSAATRRTCWFAISVIAFARSGVDGRVPFLVRSQSVPAIDQNATRRFSTGYSTARFYPRRAMGRTSRLPDGSFSGQNVPSMPPWKCSARDFRAAMLRQYGQGPCQRPAQRSYQRCTYGDIYGGT